MLTVVQASSQHLEDVTILFDLYRQFYKQPQDLDKARAFIQERLSNQDSVIFVAYHEENGEKKAVGFTQLYPTFSSISAQKSLILNDLYVDESARRLGAARALMAQAKAYGEKTGAKGLSLSTAMDNVKAQALYEDLDYQRNTRFYHYFLSL